MCTEIDTTRSNTRIVGQQENNRDNSCWDILIKIGKVFESVINALAFENDHYSNGGFHEDKEFLMGYYRKRFYG